jgi:hypothetical protein
MVAVWPGARQYPGSHTLRRTQDLRPEQHSLEGSEIKQAQRKARPSLLPTHSPVAGTGRLGAAGRGARPAEDVARHRNVDVVFRFARDSPLEEPVTSEPVSKNGNSLLAGKIQGILFVWPSECSYWLEIQQQVQWLTTQFPTHRNREFISV